MNNHQDSQPMHDLELPLVKAIQAVLAETLPDDVVSRVLQRAKRLDMGNSGRAFTTNVPVAKSRSHSPKWLLAWSVSGDMHHRRCRAIGVASLFRQHKRVIRRNVGCGGQPTVDSWNNYVFRWSTHCDRGVLGVDRTPPSCDEIW